MTINKTPKHPTLIDALIPLIVLIGLLATTVFVFDKEEVGGPI